MPIGTRYQRDLPTQEPFALNGRHRAYVATVEAPRPVFRRLHASHQSQQGRLSRASRTPHTNEDTTIHIEGSMVKNNDLVRAVRISLAHVLKRQQRFQS